MKTSKLKRWHSCLKTGFIGTLLLASFALVAGGDVTGVWVSEPTLGQLGYMQHTYTFKKDKRFSLKMDSQSFCGMGAVTPDCEYFWMVMEGDYSLSGNSLVLNITKRQIIQQQKGQAAPIIRDATPTDKAKPAAYEYVADGKSLTLIDKTTKKPLVLTRQP